jgi:polyhydroxyalkanoate synthase
MVVGCAVKGWQKGAKKGGKSVATVWRNQRTINEQRKHIMNTSDQQTMFDSWLSNFNGANTWQTWFKMPQQLTPNPLATILKEAGASIDSIDLAGLQKAYMEQSMGLWQQFMLGKLPPITDKRFSGQSWQGNPLNCFNAAFYLLNSRFLADLADAVEAPPKVKQKIAFTVQQMIDAMSPANFLVSNPEAQEQMLETKGESLTRGIANMMADMQKGRISQTNEEAFEVGKNVAITPGQVVFENELFQLLQYQPVTSTVHQVPLLLVPPCINKFYILDLQPDNSLVRYAVEQGNTVFLVSWRQPDESMARIGWDDYIEHGAIKAMHVVQDITGQKKLNGLGFCVGGTILATALAVLSARGEKPLASLTLLTSFLNFEQAGALEVFIDEEQVSRREQAIGKEGLLPGRELASTFSSLRPNDLVWNYVQSNYLKGKEPPPFDLLYWNSDSTNLPGPMFCWYLRHTYLENSLMVPNKLTVAGQKVDLGKIDIPCFIYGSREDHIVPWPAAFASRTIVNQKDPAKNRFILGASGHIAGVINSPAKKKRSYWINDEVLGQEISDVDWLDSATEYPGSWWPEWAAFLQENGGKPVKAPAKLGSRDYPPIEVAPGRYVKVRAD